MNVICFGQQNWDYCWTGKQHLATRLARRGHRVLYVDPLPVVDAGSPGDALRALAPITCRSGLRAAAPGLFVFTHHHAPPLGWRLNQWRRPRLLRALARRLGLSASVAVALHPDARPAMTAIRPAATVYYAVDEMSAFGGMPDAERRRIRAAEEALLGEVDLALAVSPRLLERFRRLAPRAYLLENGADVEHFSPARLARIPEHPVVAGLPSPRLGFVGQVDERIDQGLLVAVARARRDWQVVLAGRVKPGVDVSRLAAEPNVRLLGYQPYEALPGVLRGVDVCLVPYRSSELTQSCNPLKVFEYLATGRPVVSTPLDGLLACRDAVAIAATPEGFVRAVEASLRDPAAGRAGRLAVAAANTWDHRVDELERRLEEAREAAAGRRAIRPPRPLAPARRSDGPAPAPHPPAAPLSPRARLAFEALRLAGCSFYGLRVVWRLARGARPAGVRRILVARHCRLGDLVVFLPALSALRARYPHARIVLGVQPGMSAGALLARSRDVDEVRVVDFLSRPSRLARTAGALRLFAEGFDLVVSGASFFLLGEAFFCGAPRRIGLDDGHPLQALNSRVVPLDPTRHEAENNLAVVEALGWRGPGTDRLPRLALDGAAVDAGWQRLSARLGLPAEGALVTVHVGAQKPSRRWSPERFAELVGRLLAERPSLRIVLTGVPGEAEIVEAILAVLPGPCRNRATSAVGLTDLPALVGLLDRSAAVVCNDTGLMHLARARGTPLVALLGPENERRWGPHPLGPGPAVALRHEVPCAPCIRWSCEAHYCLRSLSVTEVAAALTGLLEGAGQPAAGAPSPLARRTAHWSWAALADAGLLLPLVTVVVLPQPLGAREHVSATRAAGGNGYGRHARWLLDALAVVAGQTYPHLEVVAVGSRSSGAPGPLPPVVSGWSLPVREIDVPQGDPRLAWRAILAAARGEAVSILVPGLSWAPEKVAAEVGLLVRSPETAAIAWADDATPRRMPPDDDACALTVRRTVLEALLDGVRGTGVELRAPAALWRRLAGGYPVARLDGALVRVTDGAPRRPAQAAEPAPAPSRRAAS